MTGDGGGERARDRQAAGRAFEVFYAEHRSFVLTRLRWLLDGTGIDPDDVASGMWTRIWRAWCARGPLVEAPRAFLGRCARNAAVDAFRARTDVLATEEELEALAIRGPGPDSSTAARQDLDGDAPALWQGSRGLPELDELLTDQRLIAASRALSPVERLVIITSIESYSSPTSAQIAQMLGISASSVRGHRMRAIKKLRELFGLPDDRGDR